MKLKLLDLFSGIGGFSLGLESTGYFETIAFVEKDKFCQQVLQKNFKDTPIESEVRNCLLYTSPSPRDGLLSRMPSSA